MPVASLPQGPAGGTWACRRARAAAATWGPRSNGRRRADDWPTAGQGPSAGGSMPPPRPTTSGRFRVHGVSRFGRPGASDGRPGRLITD